MTTVAERKTIFRKLYDWVLHWAETPYGEQALFLLAFAESSFFPVPPDILLIALVVAVSTKWKRFATIALVGSVLGGMVGYWIGYSVWQQISPFFFRYVFSEAAFETVRAAYARYDFWAVFVAGFTPIPYKVFTISGGVCHIHFATFTLASILSRGLRFFVVAGLLGVCGPSMKRLIDKYFNLLSMAFVVLLIGGFVLLRFAWQH